MYRDDPLDDEAELRGIVGDAAVDRLLAAADDLDEVERSPLEAALDVLRVLQGWVDDEVAGRWFNRGQARLTGATPVEVLADGSYDEVEDAASAWAAAQG